MHPEGASRPSVFEAADDGQQRFYGANGAANGGRARMPAVHVSWRDAAAFCAWRGKRLPTEAEWELAARNDAADTARFPWGDTLLGDDSTHRANVRQVEGERADGFPALAPVGSFAANARGVYDAIGNVWEWVADQWTPSPRRESASGRVLVNPRGPQAPLAATVEHVQKGGSFLCHRSFCSRYRVAARHHAGADSSATNVGFRCAADTSEDKESKSEL
eukprot:TRINITY_DN1705_c0_g1_i1.p2 TRINITY_DN1705_c0_g1~~TRINITY_DN1705_c0_g1_i1.p2  ORF type:complete len:219 (-),score=70.07 TRINITY_DN1705_c0_g1_i1:1-657(-)